MGKKYTPSGYQIINIDVSERAGNPFTPETIEEKELFAILSKEYIMNEKPILLSIRTSSYEIVGFATLTNNALSLTVAEFVSVVIRLADTDKLQVNEIEL